MNRLLTVQDLATKLSTTPRVIRQAIKDGKIKAHKVGKAWRVYPAEAERIYKEGF